MPRIVVASPAILGGAPAPAQPAELAQLPWVALHTFYRDEVVLTHAATGETARFPIRPKLSTDSLYAVRSAVQMGVGVGIASSWLIDEEIAAGRLLHLTPEWQAAPLPVYLVYPPAR